MNRSRGANAFTLIEMLVVLGVIIILAGILLKTTTLVINNMAKGKATHDLQQLQNALNEYYKAYGGYPPCDTMGYEYEGGAAQFWLTREWLVADLYNNPVDHADTFYPDTAGRAGWPRQGSSLTGQGPYDLGRSYGLVSFLWLRWRPLPPLGIASTALNSWPYTPGGPSADAQLHWYDKDTPRDVDAKAKWAGFLADFQLTPSAAANTIQIAAQVVFTNNLDTLLDPWGREYHYVSRPPYQSYKLWSTGRDAGDPADDLNADSSFQR